MKAIINTKVTFNKVQIIKTPNQLKLVIHMEKEEKEVVPSSLVTCRQPGPAVK